MTQPSMRLFGWGGYIANQTGWQTYVNNTIDTLHSEGRNIFRYWAWPAWRNIYGTLKQFNYTIANAIVDRCNSYGMYTMLGFNHYLPTDFVIMDGVNDYSTAWKNNVVEIGTYYKNSSNVILEPITEDKSPLYVGWTTWKGKLNSMFSALRAAGCHNKVVIDWGWSSWGWSNFNSSAVLTDPDSNYGAARHLYLSDSYGNTHLGHPTTLDLMKARVLPNSTSTTLNSIMNTYFHNANAVYFVDATNRFPLGFWVDGGGPSASLYLSGNTSSGSFPCDWRIAYVMSVQRECIEHNVPFITYRIGNASGESTHDGFQQRAMDWFGESYFEPLTVTSNKEFSFAGSLSSVQISPFTFGGSLAEEYVSPFSFAGSIEPTPTACSWGEPSQLQWYLFHHLGDVNDDGVIDATDSALISAHFGESVSPEAGNEIYDLNHDGQINTLDLAICAQHLNDTICTMGATLFTFNGSLLSTLKVPFTFGGSLSGGSYSVPFTFDGNLTSEEETVSDYFNKTLREFKKLPTPYKITIGGQPEMVIGGTKRKIGLYTDWFERMKAKTRSV